ncbi:hypothetical protein [Streptomyces sp. NPDC052107]|uniref:hypothetical protein n=1 Tax=Streptomyces sp. NPDC052107 TaxID=3155632 RepID=UPI00344263CF
MSNGGAAEGDINGTEHGSADEQGGVGSGGRFARLRKHRVLASAVAPAPGRGCRRGAARARRVVRLAVRRSPVRPRRSTWSSAKAFSSLCCSAVPIPRILRSAPTAKSAASPSQRAVAVRALHTPSSETTRSLQSPYQAARCRWSEDGEVSLSRSHRTAGAVSFTSGSTFHVAACGSRARATQPQAVPAASVTGTDSCTSSGSGGAASPFGTASGSTPQPRCGEAELTSGTTVSYTAWLVRAVAWPMSALTSILRGRPAASLPRSG